MNAFPSFLLEMAWNNRPLSLASSSEWPRWLGLWDSSWEYYTCCIAATWDSVNGICQRTILRLWKDIVSPVTEAWIVQHLETIYLSGMYKYCFSLVPFGTARIPKVWYSSSSTRRAAACCYVTVISQPAELLLALTSTEKITGPNEDDCLNKNVILTLPRHSSKKMKGVLDKDRP